MIHINIINLLLFILVCYGMTQILVYGSIFEKIRNKLKYKFFKCSMCMGFWVGIIVFILFYYNEIKLFDNICIGGFLYGCVSSGTSYALCSIFSDEGIKIKNSN